MADWKDPDILKEFGFSGEVVEIGRDNAGNYVEGPTGYPSPIYRKHFVLEDFNSSAEEIYFWLHDNITVSEGFPTVTKIYDIFSATEHSSFFGSAQQRLGAQQEKVSMFLATVGKMVKELFQIVREMRVIDERLGYYKDSMDPNSSSRENADIVLKGIWIDMVEQGAKNPASVYGMARELQFTTLPDLFFSVHPKTIADIDKDVDALDGFNRKVKEVLRRKLRNYMGWKESTYKELKNRRIFTLKYLRQHFNVIQMYIGWIRPYLKNINRMTMADRRDASDLVSAFEGSVIEIENMFSKLPPSHGEDKVMKHNKHIHSVIIMSFRYRTKPSMNYHQEYQRGALHIGSAEVTLRAYAWDQKTMDKYVDMRRKEDLKMIGDIDGGVRAAMESLGDELENYLKEAGEVAEFEKPKKEKKKAPPVSDPFIALIYGFKEMFWDTWKGAGSGGSGSSGKKPNAAFIGRETKVASAVARKVTWSVYKNFKKSHKMLAW